MNSDNPTPERTAVRPALGYKHHADCARSVHLTTTAEFIEKQNAEIEYLYEALQCVRRRASGGRRGNQVAEDVRAIAEAALKYEGS